MAYKFNKSGISHLSFAITDSETELRIPWPDFNNFMRSGAIAGDTMFAILRDPEWREIIEIDLANSFSGLTDKYLKINRGQGGSSARDWPAGTLIFLSTHADHYNSLLQPEGARQIDFNPNGVLSPDYAGEKILQYAGCQVRWWQAITAADPYWHLIAGEPCAGEEFVNPTGTFVSSVWISTVLSCYESKLTDAFWAPFIPGTYGTWDEINAWWTADSSIIWLQPIGGWEVGYRPPYIRLYRPVLTSTQVRIRDKNNTYIKIATVPIGPDGTDIEIPWGAFDLQDLIIFGKPINGIEFFSCDQETVAPANFGWVSFDSTLSWSFVRNSAVGDNWAFGSYVRVQADYRDFLITPDYYCARAFIEFDLSGVTITDFFKVLLKVQQFSTSSPGANVSMIIQESTHAFPLDFGDYDEFSGPLLCDPVLNAPSSGPSTYFIEFNEDGLDYILSRVGVGLAKFCIREFTYDWGGDTPLTSYANDFFILELIIQGN